MMQEYKTDSKRVQFIATVYRQLEFNRINENNIVVKVLCQNCNQEETIQISGSDFN